MSDNALKRLRRALLYAFLFGALGAGSVAAAGPKPESCPKVITSCGCVIDKADIYTAANDLSASQTTQPNCIEISAAGAILNLEGFKVTGNNAGVGILIRASAKKAIVEGGNESMNVPPQDPVYDPAPSPTQSKVNLWNIGIEDDADDVVIALFSDIGGSFFMNGLPVGNTTAGVLLKKVHGSFVGDFNANFNGQFGVLAEDSSNLTLANFSTLDNGDTGVKLVSSDHNVIGPAGSSKNLAFGMLLLSSSDNLIHDSNGNDLNGNTGIMLACKSGDSCPAGDGSNRNTIVNAGAPRNTIAGIAISSGSHGNTVTVTHSENNNGPNDLIDGNSDCDSNTWYNNVGRGNQGCIQ